MVSSITYLMRIDNVLMNEQSDSSRPSSPNGRASGVAVPPGAIRYVQSITWWFTSLTSQCATFFEKFNVDPQFFNTVAIFFGYTSLLAYLTVAVPPLLKSQSPTLLALLVRVAHQTQCWDYTPMIHLGWECTCCHGGLTTCYWRVSKLQWPFHCTCPLTLVHRFDFLPSHFSEDHQGILKMMV